MKREAKKILKFLIRHNPLPLRKSKDRNFIPILRYHSLDSTGSGISTSYDNWRMHLQFFQENEFQVVSLKDFFSGSYSQIEKVLIMTFDDGYQNNYAYAFKDLREQGYTATFFIVPEYTGLDACWMKRDAGHLIYSGHEYLESLWEVFRDKAALNIPYIRSNLPQLLKSGNDRCLNEIYKLHKVGKLPLMNWEEIRILSESGMDIGAHTLTHSSLGELEKEEAREEIYRSKVIIEEKIKTEVKFFCYPYGNIQNNVSELVRDSGFLGACSCQKGFWNGKDDLFHLKRIEMEMVNNRSDLDLYLNRRTRMLLGKFWKLEEKLCV